MNTGLLFLAPLGSVAALVFAAGQAAWVNKRPEGSEKMKWIAGAIRKGSKAYLKRQYKGVALFFGAMFLLLLGMSLAGYLPKVVPFAFLTGGFFSFNTLLPNYCELFQWKALLSAEVIGFVKAGRFQPGPPNGEGGSGLRPKRNSSASQMRRDARPSP